LIDVQPCRPGRVTADAHCHAGREADFSHTDTGAFVDFSFPLGAGLNATGGAG